MTDSEINANASGDASGTSNEEVADTTSRRDAPKGTIGSSRRRRVLWGLLVVLIGAGLGATVGWGSQAPLYRCEGVARVQLPEDARGSRPMHEGFLAFQVEILKSRRATLLAMEEEAWGATGEDSGAACAETFEERRRIVSEPRTLHIRVGFLDARPEVALAGVRALLAAYEKLAAELRNADERLEPGRVQLETTRAEIERLQGDEDDLVHRLEQLNRLVDQLENQLIGAGRVVIEDRGSLPTGPFRDLRPRAAAMGAVLGGALVLLVVFLARRSRARRAPVA